MGGKPAPGDSDEVSAKIIEALVQVVQKVAFIDNQPVDLGDGSLLSAAEIHLIDMTGRYPRDTISELAVRLGVTKSAVSQMVQKLVKKGYLIRGREEGNRKNICLHLTISGKKAFEWHRSLHSHVDDHILAFLSTLNPRDLQGILEIFIRLSATLDQSLMIRDVHIRNFLHKYPSDESF